MLALLLILGPALLYNGEGNLVLRYSLNPFALKSHPLTLLLHSYAHLNQLHLVNNSISIASSLFNINNALSQSQLISVYFGGVITGAVSLILHQSIVYKKPDKNIILQHLQTLKILPGDPQASLLGASSGAFALFGVELYILSKLCLDTYAGFRRSTYYDKRIKKVEFERLVQMGWRLFLGGCHVCFQVYSLVRRRDVEEGVAYAAHVGGFLFGFFASYFFVH